MAEFHTVQAKVDGQQVSLALKDGVLAVDDVDVVTPLLTFKQALNVARIAMSHEERRGVQILAAS